MPYVKDVTPVTFIGRRGLTMPFREAFCALEGPNKHPEIQLGRKEGS
jgi:hypothetical protein